MHGPLQVGKSCKLRVGDAVFEVEVIGLHDNAIHISFPDVTLPAGSASALLEFEDAAGGCSYYTQILSKPHDDIEGLLLWRAANVDQKEMRAYMRVPTEVPVRVREDATGATSDAVIENLSQGGASVLSNADYPEDTAVTLTMTLGEHPTLSVRGKVVHSEPAFREPENRYGIQFTGVDGRSNQIITLYIQARIREMLRA